MSFESGIKVGREEIRFNTGYLAKQADGAVAVSSGESIVFATAVVSRKVVEGQDFFPLTVDYREKFYSAGKIPGGYIKREGRPSDRETLTSRLTDRPLRPLFPEDFVSEVQILISVLSTDQKTQSDVLAINAASAALSVSGIPFKGPVGAVRVGRIKGEFIVNPTFDESEASDIDLVVAGTKKAVTMIEGSAKNVSEDDMINAVVFAHEQIVRLCEAQEDLKKKVGKPEMAYTPRKRDLALRDEARKRYFQDVAGLIKNTEKKDRENALRSLIDRASTELEGAFPDSIGQVASIIDDFDYELMRARILDEKKRADGRGPTEIRPIDIMIGVLPRAHGSSVFTRGQTQSLGVVTLGTGRDSQRLDALEGESFRRFMLHYNFPPFSVGETGRTGGVGRREIGHGMLAERALQYIIPEAEKFPYTIRVVSEILESNGSSSMASVCSGSLALFNAGVPVKAAVAGIAMGLILEGDRYAILSDIMGLEDHLGDMDFKVAGTSEGITAFQLDIKIEGITPEIMRKALEQAREGRLHILGKMNEAISTPEKELAPHAPRIIMIKIDVDKIGGLIGPGGKVVKAIVEETGAEINIEDDGTVTVAAVDKDSIDKALAKISAITEDVEIGRIYNGRVKKVMEYGAFVEIAPGREGLVHISKLDFNKVNKVSDILKEGDEVAVKVIGIDRQGRVDLSRKDALKR
ncbi:MAG TPA: polyribonucleotide nucleotidyltransferase [Spirochaetota bacterium]|jgi:polyribonucleotide nucleotidyltransferase|nr:MAG: Polyribonucleotide nucleotidyltransferase [Spirochaetes bacterium ADurb.BinA120]HNU92723.1 polyribonucleotide nucleotidyltransferase [Spirochaetota bacterium]HPI13076.1 polyribonucleotide nucleotidyltransferase [Spirochaetota bacterium]HPV97257.1 polyribonucleotide nucleotidyltransferase [Spirochaetota bacterium]